MHIIFVIMTFLSYILPISLKENLLTKKEIEPIKIIALFVNLVIFFLIGGHKKDYNTIDLKYKLFLVFYLTFYLCVWILSILNIFKNNKKIRLRLIIIDYFQIFLSIFVYTIVFNLQEKGSEKGIP